MTNNLISNIMATSTTVPEVGMGATVLMWSDRAPVTIVKVIKFASGARKGQVREIHVTPDTYEIVSGSSHDGSAQYEITPTDPKTYDRKLLRVAIYRPTAKGWKSPSGNSLSIGVRDVYYDPSF